MKHTCAHINHMLVAVPTVEIVAVYVGSLPAEWDGVPGNLHVQVPLFMVQRLKQLSLDS